MLTNCIICGKEFERIRKATTCSLQCSKKRKNNYNQIRRKLDPNKFYQSCKQSKIRSRIASTGTIPVRCEVCGFKFFPDSQTTVAQWDHNHDTGKGRGWLCSGCNTALGNAGDNPLILSALAKYLKTRGAAPTRPLLG